MIYLGGSPCPVGINDDILQKSFGCGYESERMFEILAMLIESEEIFRYPNVQSLKAFIRKYYVNGPYLCLTAAPILAGTPVTIIMQGSRAADYQAADAALQAKLGHLPAHGGYTWHHHERIRQRGAQWACDMYLVDSAYHREHPHKGGVYLYEQHTGRRYT